MELAGAQFMTLSFVSWNKLSIMFELSIHVMFDMLLTWVSGTCTHLCAEDRLGEIQTVSSMDSDSHAMTDAV